MSATTATSPTNGIARQALQEAHERLAQQADELRRLAHAAEQASRAKSEFLAAMSHEIRTPMTGVLGMADLLAVESLSPPQRRYLETIRNSGRHLLGIINSILDFSRIEAGRMEIERIDFSPAQVLEQAQSILAPQAAERGLELRIEQAVAAAARSPRRPDPAAAGAGQPGRQRAQVHRARSASP